MLMLARQNACLSLVVVFTATFTAMSAS